MNKKENHFFNSFKSCFHLLKENKISQDLFDNFCLELKKSYTLNEEEAFLYLIEQQDESVFLFLDTFFNTKDCFLDLAKEILFQKNVTLSEKKLDWFLSHIVNSTQAIQKNIFELNIVDLVSTQQGDCLQVLSTIKYKEFFPKNYTSNIFTYIVHAFNFSLFNSNDVSIINSTKKLLKSYQEIYQLSLNELQDSMLPSLLVFSGSSYVSHKLLSIFQTSGQEKKYHPYLVLPLFYLTSDLSKCRNIFKYYTHNNINAFTFSAPEKNVLFFTFSQVIKQHFEQQTVSLLNQDLENFSQLGYDYKKISAISDLGLKVEKMLNKVYQKMMNEITLQNSNKISKDEQLIRLEQYYLSFQAFLLQFHEAEKEGKKIKI